LITHWLIKNSLLF